MSFGAKKTKTQIKKAAKNKWCLWRLVLSDCGLDYNTVFNQMTPDEILEANAALDMKIEQERKAIKRKR